MHGIRKVESREASSQLAPVPAKLFKEGTKILKSTNSEEGKPKKSLNFDETVRVKKT